MTNETVSPEKGKASVQARDSCFIEKSGDLLEAMANAHRLQILTLLADSEINVTDLSERMGLSQSALSQHLAKLRKASLVSTRRAAQTIYYSCTR